MRTPLLAPNHSFPPTLLPNLTPSQLSQLIREKKRGGGGQEKGLRVGKGVHHHSRLRFNTLSNLANSFASALRRLGGALMRGLRARYPREGWGGDEADLVREGYFAWRV